MSMSEFEEKHDTDELINLPLSRKGVLLPADFSEEDAAFAQELDTLFALEEEELPPHFVQTLLAPEDPRFQPVEDGFEQKTSAHVFRRLKLKRHLYSSYHPALFLLNRRPRSYRSLLTLCVSLLLLVVVTVAFTGPSFASGMEIIMRGANFGTIGVKGDFNAVLPLVASNKSDQQPKQISLYAVPQQLKFPLYWPQLVPDNYNLDQVYLNKGADQTWMDGPALEFRYSTVISKGDSPDTMQLAIRVFKPKGNVFQVVEKGASQAIQSDQNGNATAIYTDGRWVYVSKEVRRWLSGTHCELLFQRDGVVFWIAADQSDGVNMQSLLALAHSFTALNLGRLNHSGVSMVYPTLINHDVVGPFDGDILMFNSTDGSGSPHLQVMGAGSSSTPKSPQKTMPQKAPSKTTTPKH